MLPDASRDKQAEKKDIRTCQAARIGAALLGLQDAIRRAGRYRQKLTRFGFSQKRWQEIVNDVEPDLRFMVRPRLLDTIIIYLHSTGKPVNRDALVRHLTGLGAGDARRIRQSITNNLRKKNLALYSRNEVGLPEWKSK